MVQIGNVPEINQVKDVLDSLKKKGLIEQWELPYENILTRLDAAYFYLTPTSSSNQEEIWNSLGKIPNFQSRLNDEKQLSKLEWEITFPTTAEEGD